MNTLTPQYNLFIYQCRTVSDCYQIHEKVYEDGGKLVELKRVKGKEASINFDYDDIPVLDHVIKLLRKE
jgi:hypothetical protein